MLVLNQRKRMVLVLVIEWGFSITITSRSTSTNKPGKTSIETPKHSNSATSKRASEGIHLPHFATEEPLLARRAGNARQAAVVARLGVHPFGIFERPEQAQLATPTNTNAKQQMGSKYQPDAPARETTSLISPPKNPRWRCGLLMHGKPQWSQLSSRLAACRVLGHKRAECCDAEQRENFKKAIFFTCGGSHLYPR